jgi:hypothetical protein
VSGGVEDEFCAQVAADSAKDVFGLNDVPNWIASTAAAGERYRFTAWVRAAQDSARARLRVREYLGTASQGSAFSEAVIANAEWKELTLDYTTRALGSTLDFNVLFDGTQSPQVVQVDEISIERVNATQPTPELAAEWAEEDEEDGHGAAVLGQRVSDLRFAATVRPTPVHDRSVLSLTLTQRSPVQIMVYDVHGRVVRRLLDAADFSVGRHEIPLEARDDHGVRLAPGVYLYRVRAAEGALSGRLVVVP